MGWGKKHYVFPRFSGMNEVFVEVATNFGFIRSVSFMLS
jgi:hypothetical protein